MIEFIIAFIFAQLVLVSHEAAHAFIVISNGGVVTSFKPYPHYEYGRFYFGHTSFAYPKGWKVGRIICSAPLISSTFLFFIGALIGAFWAPALWLSIFAVVDILWWIRGYFGLFSDFPEDLDGWKWRYFDHLSEDQKF